MKSFRIQFFFWSAFFHIRTEDRHLRITLIYKSSYSDKIRENVDQKNIRIWTLVIVTVWLKLIKYIANITLLLETNKKSTGTIRINPTTLSGIQDTGNNGMI